MQLRARHIGARVHEEGGLPAAFQREVAELEHVALHHELDELLLVLLHAALPFVSVLIDSNAANHRIAPDRHDPMIQDRAAVRTCLSARRRSAHIPKREGRVRQRFGRDGHEQHRVVIGRDPVRSDLAARGAAMEDRPLPVLAHPNSDGFHDAPA